MSHVKTGQITYAVRNTSIDGMEIAEGDIMGIGDSGMLAVGKNIEETAMESLRKMVDDESELVTIIMVRMSRKRTQRHSVRKPAKNLHPAN